jgi:hypothetical protein
MISKLPHNTFWQIGVFRITIAVSILFFVLTIIAMRLYPGGTATNPHTQGYSFFFNFFSDLGRSVTPAGQSNLSSRVLFTLALSMGALGVALFFVALTQFFPDKGLAQRLSHLGAICSLITCICFIGVALVPMNISGQVHYMFLDAALVSFIITFLLTFMAVLLTPHFPPEVVWTFSAFAILLAAYSLLLLVLLFFGPTNGTATWEVVQASGQKIIVYASILTALIQAFNMQRLHVHRPIPIKELPLANPRETGV